MTLPSPSLTVVIPALDEEDHVEHAVLAAIEVGMRHFEAIEVFVFDDGSTDRTPEIADRVAAENACVTAFHNATPQGLGAAYQRGLEMARGSHIILLNGKDDTPKLALDQILRLRDKADIIIPHTKNEKQRPFVRRVLSDLYTRMLNVSFGLGIHYYNHSVLHRVDLVRAVGVMTYSYAFQAEILIKMLRRGHSYIEVPVVDRFDPNRRSRAFSKQNVRGVAGFYLRTLRETYLDG